MVRAFTCRKVFVNINSNEVNKMLMYFEKPTNASLCIRVAIFVLFTAMTFGSGF
jgi:hypothetical protein